MRVERMSSTFLSDRNVNQCLLRHQSLLSSELKNLTCDSFGDALTTKTDEVKLLMETRWPCGM